MVYNKYRGIAVFLLYQRTQHAGNMAMKTSVPGNYTTLNYVRTREKRKTKYGHIGNRIFQF